MKNIINSVFLDEIKNIDIEMQLKRVQKEIFNRIDEYKFTRKFITEFISMYDKEQLYKIMNVIKKEIQKRSCDEINNI